VPQRRDNSIDLQVSEANRLVLPANPDPWKKMRALQVSFKDAAMVGRNSGFVTCILNKANPLGSACSRKSRCMPQLAAFATALDGYPCVRQS
jgi:hypothetical protein